MTGLPYRNVALKWILSLQSGASLEARLREGHIPIMGAAGQIGWTSRSNTEPQSAIIGRVGTVGAVTLAQSECWASDNTIVATAGSSLHPTYMYYLLLGARLPELASKTAQPLLTATAIGNHQARLPDLTEQRQIADFLDIEITRISSLTAARKSQLDCLDQLWSSRLANKADGHISSYGLLPLRRVLTSVQQGWSPQCEEVEASPSEWAVLKTSAVSSGTFLPLEHKRLPDNIAPNPIYRIEDGDILITRGSGSMAHVGVASLAHTQARRLLLSDLLYRVKITSGWSPEYVRYMLASPPVRSFIKLLLRGQSGQTIKLRSEDIKAIQLPATPTAEQYKAVQELEDAHRDICNAQDAVRRSIAVLSERRQALITAAVTGQFDVSTASGRNVTEGVSG